MSHEYTPVDLACNLKCDYCYQEPMRDAGNLVSPSDWEKAKAQLEKLGHNFSLFGGEPLIAPIEHLEEVFQFGFERFGRNGIQTNGTLITERHIELFKKYKVGVGISCDGPDELSDLRRARTDDDTRIQTGRTLAAIERLCQVGLAPSIIVTVHKLNGSIGGRAKLREWFWKLETLGVKHINLHMLEVEKGMEHLALNEEENREAFRSLYEFSLTSKMQFQPFKDIWRLMTDVESDKVNCIWNACDPLTTRAVQGVSRNGSLRNCGRTNKEGINWRKADVAGNERTLVLYNTPQEFGGCKDCRFFVFCKGNCPGTAIDGDWRNRSVHCSTWYDLLSVTERDVIREHRRPVTRDTERMKILLGRTLRDGISTHHGDTPHGDEHGDSDDRGVPVTWL